MSSGMSTANRIGVPRAGCVALRFHACSAIRPAAPNARAGATASAPEPPEPGRPGRVLARVAAPPPRATPWTSRHPRHHPRHHRHLPILRLSPRWRPRRLPRRRRRGRLRRWEAPRARGEDAPGAFDPSAAARARAPRPRSFGAHAKRRDFAPIRRVPRARIARVRRAARVLMAWYSVVAGFPPASPRECIDRRRKSSRTTSRARRLRWRRAPPELRRESPPLSSARFRRLSPPRPRRGRRTRRGASFAPAGLKLGLQRRRAVFILGEEEHPRGLEVQAVDGDGFDSGRHGAEDVGNVAVVHEVVVEVEIKVETVRTFGASSMRATRRPGR